MDIAKRMALLFLFFILFGVRGSYAAEDTHVAAYYFHGNFRCSNCYKIEEYTKEAITKTFTKELDSGELIFEIVNVDKKENNHFVDDYTLYTKSVVLSLVAGNRETEYKNLEKIWELLGDKEKFIDYINTEVREFLDKAKEGKSL
ncbi:MAG: hypothetical protein KJ952_06150 [Candidatus Omnitrophica bacterium]|nr:hypothetical protein [Candidatus Omnitrophota bacterium]